MRILVLGATGYVGSRVVPALLEAGHEVVAASSSDAGARALRVGRRGRVGALRRHRRRPRSGVALTDVEGVCYLVHSLNSRTFEERDRRGAEIVRDAVAGQRRTPDRLPLRPGPRQARRGALEAHLLASRGRAGARRGRRRDLLGGVAARRRRDRRRLDLVRGDPPARHAAARAAGAELAGAQGPADRRQRRASARWSRPSPTTT